MRFGPSYLKLVLTLNLPYSTRKLVSLQYLKGEKLSRGSIKIIILTIFSSLISSCMLLSKNILYVHLGWFGVIKVSSMNADAFSCFPVDMSGFD